MRYRTKRILIIGLSLFLLLVLYFFENISTIIRVASFILGIIIFYIADLMFKLRYEFRHYIYIILILTFGFLFAPLFFVSPNYDKILHLVSPFIGCVLIFYIIDKKDLNLQWKLFIVFIFSVSFLTLHEIGEYLGDKIWGLNLQGVYIRDFTGLEKLNPVMSKIDDTMVDLIFGTISTIIFVTGKAVVVLAKKKLNNPKNS